LQFPEEKFCESMREELETQLKMLLFVIDALVSFDAESETVSKLKSELEQVKQEHSLLL
jgi:hypothetical protein